MQEFIDIEDKITSDIGKRIDKFSKLVKDELDIDLKNVNNEQLRKIRLSLPRLLKKSGLESLKDIFIKHFNAVNILSTQLLSSDLQLGIKELNAINISNATIFRNLELDKDLKAINNSLLKKLRKNLKVNKLKRLTKNRLIDFVNELFEPTKTKIDTAVTTSVMGADRRITTIKANSVGATEFEYAGAKDSKNRKFCAERVKKVFTDKEADKWDNGQKSPASVYLGGYNCRHRKKYKILK